jgi:hypothetical protein
MEQGLEEEEGYTIMPIAQEEYQEAKEGQGL